MPESITDSISCFIFSIQGNDYFHYVHFLKPNDLKPKMKNPSQRTQVESVLAFYCDIYNSPNTFPPLIFQRLCVVTMNRIPLNFNNHSHCLGV